MTKDKKFKCGLCGKKKSKKEIHEIYENKVCNRCFTNLTKRLPSITYQEENNNWFRDFVKRMKDGNK